MAGAGYKLFNTGDVLTAAQVNTYLMEQSVMSFANAAARTTALSGILAEGMVSYLQDTNVVEVYTGAAWVSLDDPNAIQNSIVDAKGDLISATADNTPARLASSGVNGHVLTIDTSTSTGLKWAAPSSGGMTLLSTTSLTGSDVTVSSISQDYTNLYILVEGATLQTTAGILVARLDANSTVHQYNAIVNTSTAVANYVDAQINPAAGTNHSTGQTANLAIEVYNYASSSQHKPFTYVGSYYATQTRGAWGGGIFAGTSAIDSFQFLTTGGTFSAGSIKIYGVK